MVSWVKGYPGQGSLKGYEGQRLLKRYQGQALSGSRVIRVKGDQGEGLVTDLPVCRDLASTASQICVRVLICI